MTDTDKIEISNLLNSMKEMKSYADKMGDNFVDEKVLAFATEARKDYLNNKDFMKKVIQENLSLFFNLDNFEVSTSGGSIDGYYAMNREKFVYSIGAGVLVTLRLIDATTIKNTGYKIIFKVRNMEVINIRYSTSDCDDERYKISSARDLVDMCGNSFAKIPYETPKSARGWQSLYGLATWTRAKNSLLVKQFKIAMNERISMFREKANGDEKVRGELKTKIGIYVKVDL